MANFSTQIQALVGTVTESELDDWCAEGAKEIINVLPSGLLRLCTSEQTFTSQAVGSEASAATLNTGKILSVFAGTSAQYEARKIPSRLKHEANASTSMSYATATDPVYYIQNNYLNSLPAGISCKYEEVQYPSVNADSVSAIANFPDEAEYLVVLYGAIKALQNKMNEKSSDLPSALVVPVLETTSESLPTFTVPSDFIVPVKPSAPSVSAQSVTITGTAPIFVKPTRTVQTAFSSYTSGLSETDPGVFSISSVAPAAPSISTVSYTDYTANSINVASVFQTTDYPSYTSPTIGGATESLTASMSAIDNGQIGTDAEFLNFRYWYTALSEMIEDDEDIELAGAQIEKINSYVNSYNVAMQDGLNTFNEAVVKFNALVQKSNTESNYQMQKNIQEAQLLQQQRGQKAVQDLQASIENNNRKLAKFQQESNLYQANVAKEVQQYTKKLEHYRLELNTSYQAWSKTESDNIQAYQVDIQNELNKFNDENVEYQAKLQKDIQDAQLSDSNESKKLQKYQAEIGEYGAVLNTNVQKFTQEFTKNKASFDTSLQKYQSESQKVISDNQLKVQKFTSEVNDYTARLQRETTDYQWLQGQYMQLKSDYNQGLQMLISGGIPQQQQQQKGR